MRHPCYTLSAAILSCPVEYRCILEFEFDARLYLGTIFREWSGAIVNEILNMDSFVKLPRRFEPASNGLRSVYYFVQRKCESVGRGLYEVQGDERNRTSRSVLCRSKHEIYLEVS